MPEENQIQPGFQPENKANSQIQQNNLIQSQQQNQESTQQIIQQDNPIQNQQPVQGISQQIIQQSTQQNTEKPVQTIYYHPSWLTKILSGIYRFLGIFLVRAGLWNFSLIGTENLSFLKILYVGGSITLCGILYIFLGRLLYNTKSKIHLGISLLCALAVNIMFARVLMTFNDDSGIGIIIVLITLIYFAILTIRWIIKYYKFRKKGIINPKYLNQSPSKKKVGIITTIILFLFIIICLIYGKIQWHKIPKVEESTFYRTEHQVKLPDEEDGLIQLRNFMENLPDVFQRLDGIMLNTLNDKEIGRQSHKDECIIVHSGLNSYCGTRVYNRKTIYRLLNQYLDENNYSYSSTEEKGYPTNEENKITLMEYLDKNDSNIKNIFSELDNILSMNYYIPNDEYLGIFPQGAQSFARASTVLLQYYTWKKDWNMVISIIKVNYKIINIANNIGGMINNLISLVLQGIINNNINSSINLLPENVRIEITNLLKNNNYGENIIQETAKGEYVLRNRSKKIGLLDDFGANKPSLKQFLFHFPFYSYKDTERLMLYTYNMIYNEEFNDDNFEENIIGNGLSVQNLIYNHYGRRVFRNLAPRSQSFIQRLDYTEEQKDALINNLKYGEYKTRFNESYRKFNPDMYKEYQLSPDNK